MTQRPSPATDGPTDAPDRAPNATWIRYVVAVGLSAAVVLLYAMGPVGLGRETAHSVFLLPIMIGAYWGGLGPGLVATLIAALSAGYFRPVSMASDLQWAEWALMIVSGGVITIMSEALHRARRRAESAQRFHAAARARTGAAEAALRERLALQEQLTRAAANAPGVVYSFRLHTDGRMSVPYASQGVERLLGLTASQLAEDMAPVFAPMPDADAARLRGSITESARTLRPWCDEFRVRITPDGPTWLEGRCIPQREPDGSVLWNGILTDVTERKRTEDALRSARATMQLLIEQAPVSIAVLDRNMVYVAASRRWMADYGRGNTDLIGQNHYVIHPDVPESWKSIHQECLAGAVRSADDDLWVQLDGTRHWLRWAIHPWRNGNDEIGGIIIFAEDVTERKRAAEALRDSEQRYRDLVQMSPDAILVSRENLIVFANPAALALFGAARAEALLNRSPLDLVPPDFHDSLREHITLTSVDGALARPPLRYRIVRFDGRECEVESTIAPFADHDGSAIQIIVRDVTERDRTERAIAEREARLAGIINSALDGMISLDAQHKIALVNPAAEHMFGYSAAELLGQPLDRLLPQRFRNAHSRQVEGFSRSGVTRRRMDSLGVIHGLRRNGEEFPLEASLSHLSSAGGTFSTVILRDVTERHRSEQALRASEERFRELAENIREVFWISDVRKERIEYVSPAYETIFGRSPEALRTSARDWVDAIHPDDRERVLQAALTTQADGTYDEQYRISRPDNTHRWIRDRAFPVHDDQGRVIRIVGVAEDVTERRELEMQLRQTQKLESIGLLAGGIAHDFNNWLTVISGNGELLAAIFGPDDEATELISEIRHAGERAASLTRQLLAFSRQQVLETKVLDLNDIVADTERMLRRLIGEDVILTTALDSDAGRVRVDPGHWVQVLMNLAVNARDAMPTGGRLSIETKRVVLDDQFARSHPGAKAGRHVQLTVTDTGLGMTPDVRARMFEPFFTTKSVGKGTGLGLAVVHGIVTQSGGTIDVRSEINVGTTFRILLPEVDAQATAIGGAAALGGPRGTETVLLVEDDESVRRVAVRALRARGYTVIAAADGVEALSLLASAGPIDLLLTDVVMPNMGGRELRDAVHLRHPGIKVLFTSGYTDDAVVRHGVLEDDVAFIQKPYKATTLAAKVREVLDQQR